MTEQLTSGWVAAWSNTPGPQALEWALLLAVATLAGHWVQRYTQLPKIIGYAVVGAITGWVGIALICGSGLYVIWRETARERQVDAS